MLIALLMLVVAATSRTWWDPRLGRETTARALQAQLHTRYGFRCIRQEKDESIPLDDVDYLCWPPDLDRDAYWVGTNSRRITDLLPMP